jgi:hypothetical protein
MGKTITYPDGSQLVSSALTDTQVESFFQIATQSALGILVTPLIVSFSFSNGSNSAGCNTLFLYPGLLVVSSSVPAGTTIVSIGTGEVTLSNKATTSGTQNGTVTDPNLSSKVRIGWQQEGQPFNSIDQDTTYLRCDTMDTEYSRLHDQVGLIPSGTVITIQDVFTRRWRTAWTFYGPNALDNARALKSGLTGVDYVISSLASNSLFVDPSIEEIRRVPELFQGQWWERVDLTVEFNEEITESLIVGSVASVEVKVYTSSGEIADFTVTT